MSNRNHESNAAPEGEDEDGLESSNDKQYYTRDEPCNNCGGPITLPDKASEICPHCGEPWMDMGDEDVADAEMPKESGVMWGWISFWMCVFLPHFGFIVCLWVANNTTDKKAKELTHYGLQVCKVWLVVLGIAFMVRFWAGLPP